MILNKFHILFFISFTIIIISIVFVAVGRKDKFEEKPLGAKDVNYSNQVHPNVFFEEQTFVEGILTTSKENNSSDYIISGGIIPHHLLPGFIITDFFNKLSIQNPQTIILIGPNHFELGDHRFLSSTYDWDTPYGNVKVDKKILDELINNKIINIDDEVLPGDHAVAGIMPFIEYYLPEAKVVPILISGYTTQDEAYKFANEIEKYVDENVVIIAAVDFSHYLTSDQANKKDKLTLQIINDHDYRQLFTLNNDYLDSPASIAVLTMIMRNLGKDNKEIYYHTNSGELQNDNFIETTSYFSISFH